MSPADRRLIRAELLGAAVWLPAFIGLLTFAWIATP